MSKISRVRSTARRNKQRRATETENKTEKRTVSQWDGQRQTLVQWRFNEVSASLIAQLVYGCSGKRATAAASSSSRCSPLASSFDLATTPGPARRDVKWDNKQRKTWKSYQWKIGLTARRPRTDANSASTRDALRGDGRRARLMQIRRQATADWPIMSWRADSGVLPQHGRWRRRRLRVTDRGVSAPQNVQLATN